MVMLVVLFLPALSCRTLSPSIPHGLHLPLQPHASPLPHMSHTPSPACHYCSHPHRSATPPGWGGVSEGRHKHPLPFGDELKGKALAPMQARSPAGMSTPGAAGADVGDAVFFPDDIRNCWGRGVDRHTTFLSVKKRKKFPQDSLYSTPEPNPDPPAPAGPFPGGGGGGLHSLAGSRQPKMDPNLLFDATLSDKFFSYFFPEPSRPLP